MFAVGLTAYFVVSMIGPLGTEISLLQSGVQYTMVSCCGSLCAILAYMLPLPGLPGTHALPGVAKAFGAVADGCAEVITEATAAFLASGAGDAWRSLARQKLASLAKVLEKAHGNLEYQDWSLSAALRLLSRRGRQHSARRKVQQERAFSAASDSIDTCYLLIEIAARPHDHVVGMEAAVVRSTAAPLLVRVAENATALLRDFARTNFRESWLDSSMVGDSDVVGDERRRHLRQASSAALGDSSLAAQELLLLGQFQHAEGSSGQGMSIGEFASARSDMAAFLFLVHSLAADLLRRSNLDLGPGQEFEGLEMDENQSIYSPSPRPHGALDAECQLADLRPPLLQRSGPPEFEEQFDPHLRNLSPSQLAAQTSRRVRWALEAGAAAVQQRWHVAVKVSISFTVCLATSIYWLNLDSTLVCSVAYLCSYGSQYAGGSLRRSVLRAVGVASGATAGSALQQVGLQLSISLGDADWAQPCVLLFALVSMALGVFLGMLLAFHGGQYSYIGEIFSLFLVKFLASPTVGSIKFGPTVETTMYACMLAVLVEMCVMPVDAQDLLRARLAAAHAGVAAALPALVTSSVDESDRADVTFPRLKSTDLCNGSPLSTLGSPHTAASQAGIAGKVNHSLPDLTERLKEAGIYDKYLSWSEGYKKWRTGAGKGAKGELRDETQPSNSSYTVVSTAKDSGIVPRQLAGALENTLVSSPEVAALSFAPAVMPGIPQRAVLEPIAEARRISKKTIGYIEGQVEVRRASSETLGSSDACGIQLVVDSGGNSEAQSVCRTNLEVPSGYVQGVEPASLDPVAAVRLPTLAVLLNRANTKVFESHDAAAGADTDVGTSYASLDELTMQSRQGTQASEDECGGFAQPALAPNVSNVSAITAPTTITILLADVEELLDEISVVLAPAAELVRQAAERLDSERVDAHAWCALADKLNIMRLRLSLLARLALRLRHGVSVTDLLGGPGAEPAAEALISAFCAALEAATSAVAGGPAPTPRVCARLEAELRASAAGLAVALGRRRVRRHRRRSAVAAEVLAGTAGHALTALLRDAAQVLALATAVAGPCPEPVSSAADDLPDLTERLKQQGQYEKYLEWREGYMKWRTGGTSGTLALVQSSIVQWVHSVIVMPRMVLKGFQRTRSLEPRDTQQMSFAFSVADLSLYSVQQGGWVAQSKAYIWFGASSGDIRKVIKVDLGDRVPIPEAGG
ncbi:unnamed protein product [Polarella glacialis]|uniref:Fibronectin type III-like domain-containing protein n=1 Tax=Polarella glacialis TaxID=89957 RepID=A0A813I0W6_POLGL|nr:unnamed protein product [Polarella glacialis]